MSLVHLQDLFLLRDFNSVLHHCYLQLSNISHHHNSTGPSSSFSSPSSSISTTTKTKSKPNDDIENLLSLYHQCKKSNKLHEECPCEPIVYILLQTLSHTGKENLLLTFIKSFYCTPYTTNTNKDKHSSLDFTKIPFSVVLLYASLLANNLSFSTAKAFVYQALSPNNHKSFSVEQQGRLLELLIFHILLPYGDTNEAKLCLIGNGSSPVSFAPIEPFRIEGYLQYISEWEKNNEKLLTPKKSIENGKSETKVEEKKSNGGGLFSWGSNHTKEKAEENKIVTLQNGMNDHTNNIIKNGDSNNSNRNNVNSAVQQSPLKQITILYNSSIHNLQCKYTNLKQQFDKIWIILSRYLETHGNFLGTVLSVVVVIVSTIYLVNSARQRRRMRLIRLQQMRQQMQTGQRVIRTGKNTPFPAANTNIKRIAANVPNSTSQLVSTATTQRLRSQVSGKNRDPSGGFWSNVGELFVNAFSFNQQGR
eukprot:TRINITY_DN6321_c1_g1_i1.p1 TRINITY_DN6321_c1_g1~~TRINITY_DN6321_c1_g1_i1.p1  ORF type:complete len:477 (+),score=96.05 TRINITY_DN6321_c1_g1_i1:354-1784(+)